MRIRTDPATFAAVVLVVMVAAIAVLLLVLGGMQPEASRPPGHSIGWRGDTSGISDANSSYGGA
jgi:hypothetical protein